MSAEAGGLWVAVVFACVLGAITLGFAIYQSQKGAVPGQREEMRDMHAELTRQKVLVEALQRQAFENWSRIQTAETLLAKIQAENAQLKSLTNEQAILITALQRQLGGLARTGDKIGRRLRDVLTRRLTKEELASWAFEVGVPMENLSGETLPALVISMLDYLNRHELLEEGLAELRRLRPDLEKEIV